jgi:MSHA pilin protein MshD
VRTRRGFSLVELVLAIVVMGIALAAATTLFVVTTRHSADPMIQQQAQLIAESYLDEILIKRFYDPDTNNVCPAAEGGGRTAYDNVCDYNGLNEAPRDQFGTAIAALSAYTVQVTVANAGVALNGVDNTGVVRVLRVDVTVTGPASISVTVSSYRTNYECNTLGDAECKLL